MTLWVAPKGAIAVPYTPDDHLGEFGWIWTNAHRGDPAEWHLVSTHLPDGKDAEPVITFHAPDGTHPLDEGAADTWGGCPYLPMIEPKGGPGAGLEVTVRLDAGASTTVTWEEPNERSDRMRREVLTLLTIGENDPRSALVYDALRACVAVLYDRLCTDIESACPMRDGVPDLRNIDAEARPFLDPLVRAIQGAEAVAAHSLKPADTPNWLSDAIDGWWFEETAP